MNDYDKITNILLDHASKNFVNRILNRSLFPVLKNPDGSVSTHSMAWGESDDGKMFVYPTVIQGKNGLERLSDDDAWNYAHKTGELIEFPSRQKADWFSKKYKLFWDKK